MNIKKLEPVLISVIEFLYLIMQYELGKQFLRTVLSETHRINYLCSWNLEMCQKFAL